MQITEDQVRQALSTVAYPGFSRDIVSFGLVKAVGIDGVDVTVKVSLATKDPKVPQLIYDQAKAALKKIVAADGWASFGHIAAEADLARMRK